MLKNQTAQAEAVQNQFHEQYANAEAKRLEFSNNVETRLSQVEGGTATVVAGQKRIEEQLATLLARMA